MGSTSPVALILGAGPNIGLSAAKEFADNESWTYVQGDLSDPASVDDIFSRVRKTAGEPSVVVYNAAAVSRTLDPFEIDLKPFQNHFDVNTASAFMAIKQSLISFTSLPESASCTFIYTGNAMNFLPFAGVMSLGAMKSASAHMIHAAAIAYKDKGYKFYYADERQADGRLAGRSISGEAHAKLYLQRSQDQTQGPWLQTFVKDKGYIWFPADTDVSFK